MVGCSVCGMEDKTKDAIRVGLAVLTIVVAGLFTVPVLSALHTATQTTTPTVRMVSDTPAHEPLSTPTPTPTPTEALPPALPLDPTPAAEQPVDEPPAATVDENGAVTGEGCPPPYVDNGYGCQVPICGVDENGNDVPCQP